MFSYNINEKLKISNGELKLTAQSLPSFHDCALSQVAFLEPQLDGCCRRGPPAMCGSAKMDEFDFFLLLQTGGLVVVAGLAVTICGGWSAGPLYKGKAP